MLSFWYGSLLGPSNACSVVLLCEHQQVDQLHLMGEPSFRLQSGIPFCSQPSWTFNCVHCDGMVMQALQ